MTNIDTLLTEKWNQIHPDKPIREELCWELCRIFEKYGFLEGNQETVSVTSIGPFHIAYDIDIRKKNIFTFFLSELVPIWISKNPSLDFHQLCLLYLLPAATILLTMADKFHLVKDELQWEILLFVKRQNVANKFPTIQEIIQDPSFSMYSSSQINDALVALMNVPNYIGDKDKLIEIDYDHRVECLV